MPITRRRRANPPDQPENNHTNPSEQPEEATESLVSDQAQPAPPEGTPVEPPVIASEPLATPRPFQSVEPSPGALPSLASPENNGNSNNNGDRSERSESSPVIESGRRTARGEFFRRPPQPPPSAQPPATVGAQQTQLQPPSHEITLPLGNLLHLAYNPSYTGAEEARSELLHRLESESKAGGRARCWNCGSLAIVYDCWNTRSKNFGEIGVALCEICGVWSVL